jgi:hypothetical protein
MITRLIIALLLILTAPVYAGQGMGPGPGTSRSSAPLPQVSLITDDFNRANSSDLGSNWADMGVSNTGVSSNQASGVGNNRWSASVLDSANMYVQIKNGAPFVRTSNSSITAYSGVYDFDETEDSFYYAIYKIVDGVTTAAKVEAFVDETSFTHMRLEATGTTTTTLTLKYSTDGSTWSTFGSGTDSLAPLLGTGVAFSCLVCDDFEGGTL